MFTILDLVIIAVLILSALLAAWRGFTREVLSIGAWVGAAVVMFLAGPTAVPFAQALDSVLDLIAEDAQVLGCERDVARARALVAEGTSADRQIAAADAARAEGRDERAALAAAVDWIAGAVV